MQSLKNFIEAPAFQRFVIAVIVLNAITLGLETSSTAMETAGGLLYFLDRAALAVFVTELVLKLVVYRHNFFRDGWNVFDFLVVGITLLPANEGMSVLRALRILRALRLVSVVPSMRKVVNALLKAVPGMMSVLTLLLLVFYVSAVMSTKLFGASFPEWFGSLGASAFTLFQIMTLESWSMGIVRPVMAVYPLAWMFFIMFILLTTFAVLNLFIAIVVDAMSVTDHEEQEETRTLVSTDHAELMAELRLLRSELADMRERMGSRAD